MKKVPDRKLSESEIVKIMIISLKFPMIMLQPNLDEEYHWKLQRNYYAQLLIWPADYFQSWQFQILTIFNSENLQFWHFWFWQFPIKNKNEFWQFPVLTISSHPICHVVVSYYSCQKIYKNVLLSFPKRSTCMFDGSVFIRDFISFSYWNNILSFEVINIILSKTDIAQTKQKKAVLKEREDLAQQLSKYIRSRSPRNKLRPRGQQVSIP